MLRPFLRFDHVIVKTIHTVVWDQDWQKMI
jgi:hypothetical protein